MNLGQTMITAGMLVLLIMSVVSANRLLLENTLATVDAEARAESVQSAGALLSEAMSKKFDEKADLTGTQDTTMFSIPGMAGWAPGKGEKFTLPDSSYKGEFKSIPTSAYDDLDDYDGYWRLVKSVNISGWFKDTVKVFYVKASAPTVPTLTRTYYKVIRITVTHPSMSTPVEVSGMMSY